MLQIEVVIVMIDTIKIRGPTMQAVQEEKHTHVQRWQQHKSLKTGQRLSGSRVVHPFISMVDGFETSIPDHHRKLFRDARRGQERLYQSAYDTSCPKTAREYRRSQPWHCSNEHMIAVVALD